MVRPFLLPQRFSTAFLVPMAAPGAPVNDLLPAGLYYIGDPYWIWSHDLDLIIEADDELGGGKIVCPSGTTFHHYFIPHTDGTYNDNEAHKYSFEGRHEHGDHIVIMNYKYINFNEDGYNKTEVNEGRTVEFEQPFRVWQEGELGAVHFGHVIVPFVQHGPWQFSFTVNGNTVTLHS